CARGMNTIMKDVW
nr:immunoglobulin heavy chain junction region [Macaca mulatta]